MLGDSPSRSWVRRTHVDASDGSTSRGDDCGEGLLLLSPLLLYDAESFSRSVFGAFMCVVSTTTRLDISNVQCYIALDG